MCVGKEEASDDEERENLADLVWSFDDDDDDATTKRQIRLTNAAEAGSLTNTTGWTTWDSAFAVMHYLSRRQERLVQNKTILDIATGNGLVALGCAALGAKSVVATEVESCLNLPNQNVELNCCCCRKYVKEKSEEKCWACHVDVQEYKLGGFREDKNKTPAINGKSNFDLAIICDLLFISIRDEFEKALKNEIIRWCKAGTEVLFAYEERVCNKEEDFFAQFTTLEDELTLEEIPSSEIETSTSRPEDEDNNFGAQLFYEPPPVRFFMFRRQENAEAR